MKISKGLIIVGILVLIVVFFGGCAIGTMNTMNKMKVTIEEKQGEIQNMLQNRCDMVNQLVAETKGSVIAESKYMKDVIEARNGLSTALSSNNIEQIAEAIVRDMNVIQYS